MHARSGRRATRAGRSAAPAGRRAAQRRSRPERHAGDGGVLGEAALVARQTVEAGRDQRLQALRHRKRLESPSASSIARVREHVDGLLEEERVPVGVRGARSTRGAREAALLELRDELGDERSLSSALSTSSAITVLPLALDAAASAAVLARARAAPRRARGPDHRASPSDSMSSMSVGSAQCRSSSTSSSGRVATRAARGCGGCPSAARPARCPWSRRSRAASSARRAGSTSVEAIVRSWSRSSRGRRSSRTSSFDETTSCGRSTRMPAASSQDLHDRPVGDALAVGEAAARRSTSRAVRAVRQISCRSRLLPRPGSPTTIAKRRRARLAITRLHSRRSAARARRRGRRSGASRTRPRTGASCTPTALPHGHGLGLALRVIGSCVLELDRSAAGAVGLARRRGRRSPGRPTVAGRRC